MIKVGDKVKVINWGKQFITNKPWFRKHSSDLGFNFDWAVRYQYNNKHINMKDRKDILIYNVLYIADNIALITRTFSQDIINNLDDSVFLISLDGLEKIEPEIKDYYLPIKCKLKENDLVKIKMIRNSDNKECAIDLDINKYDGQLIDLSEDYWYWNFLR